LITSKQIIEAVSNPKPWAVVQSGGVPLTSGEYQDNKGRRLVQTFDDENDAKVFANSRNLDKLKSSSFTKRNIKYFVINILTNQIKKV
jgi:hypothetical protein